MTATFVVEDGTGLSTANSYISVGDADFYHENHGNPSDWSSASDATKQEALRMAFQCLNVVYGAAFQGYKVKSTQAGEHPRYERYDFSGFLYASNEVCIPIKEASCELAKRHITETDGLFPDIEDGGTVKSYSVKAGPIEESTTYEGGREEYKRFSIVDAILKPILRQSGVIRRG